MRRKVRHRRSAAEWTIRSLLAVVVVTGAYTGIRRTAAYALRSVDVDMAHTMAPEDGRITALKAETMLQSGDAASRIAQVEQFAQQALLQDPTAVTAAATLGISAQTRGDGARADRLLNYAQRLSRRDLQTQIWAIEAAVTRGDIRGALRHYDIALRTSSKAPDLLFPVLASAISDADIRAALVRTLSVRPPWSQFFLDHIAGSAPDQRAVATFYNALGRVGVPVSQGAQAAVIDTLIARGELDAAWTYYATVRPGAVRSRSRDPEFGAMLDTPTPLDWVPVNDAGISSSIQRSDRGGLFDFSVSSGIGGIILRQRQLLTPGNYRLRGHSTGIEQPAASRPYWTLICAEGEERGQVEVPYSAQGGGFFSGQLSVPAGCPVQTLALVARSTDKLGGVTGQIDQLQLYPER